MMDAVAPLIIAEARSWVDTPYHHQASRKGVGCDCYGLVWGVAMAVPGLWRPPRVTRYSALPSARMARICARDMDRIGMDELAPGDVVHIRFHSHPQHLAIVTADNTVVHSMANLGAVREHRYGGYWRSLTVQAYRLRRLSP